MKTAKLPGLICLLVLCGILVAGLWPFHSPQNDVYWLRTDHGVRLRRHSTILSAGTFKLADSQATCSLEVWLTPALPHDSSTVLAFYSPEDPLQFSLRRYDTALMLTSEVRDERQRIRNVNLGVDNIFRRGESVFITITSSEQKTAVYMNGDLARGSSRFSLAGRLCTGQLVVGDSPVGTDTWIGKIQGLAIYNEELPAARVVKHYESWTRTGRPELARDEGKVALYLFDEGVGNIVHNAVHSGIDLYIPQRYLIVNQVLLEPFWREYRWSLGYWRSIALNIAGFIPLGWCCYPYWRCVRRIRQAALATVLLGAATSLTIEVSQGWLPTRSSGTMDLVTNTLGTCLGVLLWRSALVQSLFAKAGVKWAEGRFLPSSF